VQVVGVAGGGINKSIARSLRAQPNCTHRADSDNFIIDDQPFKVANTLTARMHKGINTTVDEGQTPVVHGTQDPCVVDNQAHTLGRNNGGENAVLAVSLRGREGGATAEVGGTASPALRAADGGGSKPHVLSDRVRRLTPIECERLQGFPDGWTDVPYRGKPAADGPRYKAIGNSKATTVVRWIGGGIKQELGK
jgi:DNA (cytosine-5)-methyltransferase 1